MIFKVITGNSSTALVKRPGNEANTIPLQDRLIYGYIISEIFTAK